MTVSKHEAYAIEGGERPSRWLVTVDHATNRVPEWIGGGTLGIAAADMVRHIAYDPGALGVGRHLAQILDAPLVHSDFSRLVIDPNRGEDDPTLIMQIYDGTVIAGNRDLSPDRVQERLDRLYRPYHDALERLAENRALCAIHSFTPRLRAQPPRPWQIGILSAAQDRRISDPLIAALRAMGITTGDNEPYAGHLEGDSIDRHALIKGRPNVLIELRNDLIADDAAQADWARRLAPVLTEVLDQLGA